MTSPRIKLKITIEVEGEESCDVECALDEAFKKMGEGYVSGSDDNDASRYNFEVENLGDEGYEP